MDIVIIGAGRTGRGFIAPIVQQNNCNITFIDKDEMVIKKLNEVSSYFVSYFDNKENYEIKNYSAYTNTESAGIKALQNADIIFTSVYAHNLKDLTELFEKAINKRKKKKDLVIICCENGINVKKPFMSSNLRAKISEGIIFCTTIEKENSFDLYSESIFELPVDNNGLNLKFNLKGINLTQKFDDLIQRKIYTYNFLSALIGYLGHYKGYTLLNEASNDKDIKFLINTISPHISSVIAQEFRISYNEQLEFTQRAIRKFSNPKIPDSIYRNIIDTNRKLNKNERLLKPLYLLDKYNKNIDVVLTVIASALNYGGKNEELDVKAQYSRISKIVDDQEVEKVRNILSKFEENKSLSSIINCLEI